MEGLKKKKVTIEVKGKLFVMGAGGGGEGRVALAFYIPLKRKNRKKKAEKKGTWGLAAEFFNFFFNYTFKRFVFAFVTTNCYLARAKGRQGSAALAYRGNNNKFFFFFGNWKKKRHF